MEDTPNGRSAKGRILHGRGGTGNAVFFGAVSNAGVAAPMVGAAQKKTGALVMYRSILLSTAAIALMAGSISAQASCGAPLDGKARVVNKLPSIRVSRALAAPMGYGSIVGMWTNSIIVGGNVVATSISTWHSDGTEYDNIDAPPISGNVCQGVWESKGPAKVEEHHFGWTFDQNSNPSGYFTLEQTLKLGNHGTSYSGPFDQKFYDNQGNLLTEVMGTMSAQRFTGD